MPLRKAILFYSRTSPVSNTCSSEYTSGGSRGGARAPTPPSPAFLRPPLLISMSGSGTVHCILFCPTEVFDLVYCLATFTFNCVGICSDRYISGIGWLVGGSFMSETFLAINVTV